MKPGATVLYQLIVFPFLSLQPEWFSGAPASAALPILGECQCGVSSRNKTGKWDPWDAKCQVRDRLRWGHLGKK